MIAATLFSYGWWRLRSRGRPDLAGIPKALMFAAGLAVLLFALLSPLDPVGEEYLLSVHMSQHLLLGDVAPLLLVGAIAGPLALFVVPRPVLRGVGRNRGARRVIGVITLPVTAVVVWLVVTVGWHIPFFFEAALTHRWVHDLEHLSFLVAGTLLWMTILGVVPRRRMSRLRRAAVAVGIFAAGMVVSQTLFVSDPLYLQYSLQDERLFGLSAKADQTIAAMLMTTEQMLTLGTAAGLLMWAAFDHRAARARAQAQEGAVRGLADVRKAPPDAPA